MSLLGIEALVRSMLLVSWTRAIEGGGVASWMAGAVAWELWDFSHQWWARLCSAKMKPNKSYMFFSKKTRKKILKSYISNYQIIHFFLRFLDAAFRLIWSKLYRCDLDL